MNKKDFDRETLAKTHKFHRRENVSSRRYFPLHNWQFLTHLFHHVDRGIAGVLYYLITPPITVRRRSFYSDPKLPQIFREAGDLGQNLDSAQIETHIVALKSRAIALAVVNRLKLWNDPEFQEPDAASSSWIGFWRMPVSSLQIRPRRRSMSPEETIQRARKVNPLQDKNVRSRRRIRRKRR